MDCGRRRVPESTSSCRASVVRRYQGVDAHRSVTLTDQDVTTVDSIPVTTLARMMLDLATVVEQRAVERVIARGR